MRIARSMKFVLPAKSVTLSKRRAYVITKKVNWNAIVTIAVSARSLSSIGLDMLKMMCGLWC